MTTVIFLLSLLVGCVYSQAYGGGMSPPATPAPSGATPAPTPAPSGATPAPTPAPSGATPAPPAPTPGPSPPSGNVCAPTPPTYTTTGEALFQQLLKDLAVQEVNINNIAKANNNAPVNNVTNFFLSVIVNTNNANIKLQSLTNGATISGADCLQTNVNLGVIIGQVQGHASDTIPGGPCASLTGEAKNQYALQQLGQALNGVQQQAQLPANQQNTNPGPWLTIMQGLDKAITRIQKVIQNNDTSAECTYASIAIATALKGILSSNNAVIS